MERGMKEIKGILGGGCGWSSKQTDPVSAGRVSPPPATRRDRWSSVGSAAEAGGTRASSLSCYKPPLIVTAWCWERRRDARTLGKVLYSESIPARKPWNGRLSSLFFRQIKVSRTFVSLHIKRRVGYVAAGSEEDGRPRADPGPTPGPTTCNVDPLIGSVRLKQRRPVNAVIQILYVSPGIWQLS